MLLVTGHIPLKDIPIAEPPSITEQTKWPCQFFNFGKAQVPGVEYFNCGFVERPDGEWLVTRRSFPHGELPFGMNDIMAFKLDNKTPAVGMRVRIPTSLPNEQFEDPRSIYHEGRTYLSFCNFSWKGRTWTGAHQGLAVVDDKWQALKRYGINYGQNGDGVARNTGNEKNWLWFFHEGKPHLIYLSDPHTIARFSPEFVFEGEHITANKSKWDFGLIRGGTPPVQVDGEYWSFFHSSLPWTSHKRRYFMAAYSFEARPPFQMRRISRRPILIGSWRDPWAMSKPLVVFPCGSRLKDGKWFITLGVNDMASAWIEIPHEDVLNGSKRI